MNIKSNIFKIIDYIYKKEPRLLLFFICKICFQVVCIFTEVYLIYFLIRILQSALSFKWLACLIAMYCIVQSVSSYFTQKLDVYIKSKVNVINHTLMMAVGQVCMEMSYQEIDHPDTLSEKERAVFPIINQSLILKLYDACTDIVSGMIVLAISGIIVIQTDMLLCCITLVFIVLMMWFKNKKVKLDKKNMEKIIPLNRMFSYYMQIVSDYKFAKDIRAYNFFDLIIGKVKDYTYKSNRTFKAILKSQSFYNMLDVFIKWLFLLCAVCILLYKHRLGSIDRAGVIVLFVLLQKVSAMSEHIISASSKLKLSNAYFGHFFSFIDKYKNTNTKQHLKTKEEKIEKIVFKNMSFSYPHCDKVILKDINLTLEHGKTYAVVGENGAGKTTLLRLLLGHYTPCCGEIFINDSSVDHSFFSTRDNFASTLFQDFQLFSFSALENIIFDTVQNDEKLYFLMDTFKINKTFFKDVSDLNKVFYQVFDKEGILLSRGDEQKLALARAFYKQSDLRFLDEPTSALDPVLEADIIKNLKGQIKENTQFSMLISHRMSMCKIVDEIIVLKSGCIVQQGDFKSLIKNNDGHFYSLWSAQSNFYV